MAQTWAGQYTIGKNRNGQTRSPRTAASGVGAACILWEHWLYNQRRVVPAKSFAEMKPPKTDKPTVRIPSDDQLEDFDKWLADRFLGWALPWAFFRVKGLSGCRVADLCQLRTDQLRAGRLHFDPDQTKGRKGRAVPLPPELFADLDTVKGRRLLWDNYPARLKACLKAKGWPTHRLKDFDPGRMLAWVMTLFADFNADRPGQPKLTSHQFRKKVFNEAFRAGVSLDEAAIAYGSGVDTIKGHYLGVSEQEITDGVFERMSRARTK